MGSNNNHICLLVVENPTEQNNFDLALEVLINILDKFEITSRLFLLIVRCFYSMGDFELAEEYYQKVKDLKD